MISIKGLWHLFVLGGKKGNTDKSWLNSIESLNLTNFMFPWLAESKEGEIAEPA